MIPALLRENASFRRFYAGQLVSLGGDQVSAIALPLTAVLLLHAHAAQMGYLTAAGWLPYLLFGLHAGAALDRRGRRRRTMIAADVGRFALLASVPVCRALGVLTLAQLYAIAFAAGTLAVFFTVSYGTLFAAVVPRERTVEANQLLHGGRALAYVAGPSLGGALVQLLSAPIAVGVDAISFLVSALSLRGIRAVEPEVEAAARGHVAEGLRTIRRVPLLRSALLATATINLFNFVFAALWILYATRTLGVSPGVIGAVAAAGAVGAVAGSVAAGAATRRIGVGRVFVAGSLLFPAPLVLVPAAGGPHALVLALLVLAELGSGFGVMLLDIAAGSVFQAAVPDRLRARFSGAYTVVNYGVRPLGAVLGGVLGSALGLREALWIATVGGVAGVFWLLPSPYPHLRELPAEPVV